MRLMSTDPHAQLLQDSKVPTMHYQASLPRLPVPKLEDTLKRYLDTTSAIATPEEYAATTAAVREFEKGDGPRLQEALVAKDKRESHTSYISKWWFDKYLAGRDSVVINSNPFLAFIEDPRGAEANEQSARAAAFTHAAVKFMQSLRANKLDPDVFHTKPEKSDTEWFKNVVRFVPSKVAWYFGYFFGAYALDMSQYKSLFATTRVPRATDDEILTDPTTRHVTVIHKNRFYKLPVFADDGSRILTRAEIHGHITAILDGAKSLEPAADAVGVLTSENRSVWAGLRDEMVATGNQKALDDVERGIFALCLDHEAPEDRVGLTHHFLHGDGKNRWFDKSFSLIVAPSGVSAINFEHAWGDGVAVLRFAQDAFKDTIAAPPSTPDQAIVAASKAAQPIEFELSDGVKKGIQAAADRLSTEAERLQIVVHEFNNFGKNHIKKIKLSPDGFAQVAYQLAYYRTYGKTVSTYESASTAGFRHGRTECIRSATPQSKKFCEHFDSPEATDESRMGLLKTAIEAHSKLVVNAAMGQGIDRHLFGLKMMALAENGNDVSKLPKIFQDEVYSRMGYDILSTSTLQSPQLDGGGFGPVVPDGYGIGYAVMDERMGWVLSSYKTQEETSKFALAIDQTLVDMGKLFE